MVSGDHNGNTRPLFDSRGRPHTLERQGNTSDGLGRLDGQAIYHQPFHHSARSLRERRRGQTYVSVTLTLGHVQVRDKQGAAQIRRGHLAVTSQTHAEKRKRRDVNGGCPEHDGIGGYIVLDYCLSVCPCHFHSDPLYSASMYTLLPTFLSQTTESCHNLA